MKGFDLPVMDGTRKSFCGKAKVIEHDNGDICLISYSTLVARIHNGNFEKLWDGYSATTMRHIIHSFYFTIFQVVESCGGIN